MKLAIAFVATLLAFPAHAMTYSLKTSNSGAIIRASGDVESDEGAVFTKWLAANDKAINGRHVTVELNSPGGAIDGGISMGEIVQKAHFDTDVKANGGCYSICALIWASGINKGVEHGARVGVHSASYSGDGRPLDIEDIEGLHESTEAVASIMAQLGAPADVLEAIRYCPGDDLYFLTWDDLRAWNTHFAS